MKGDTGRWLAFAKANLGAARCVFENGYFNPCLQEAQQAIEKMLKALLIETSDEFKKTHSIREIRELLKRQGVVVALDDEECAFLDAIYLPSKYPLGSILPDGEPDAAQCEWCLSIAGRVLDDVLRLLEPEKQKKSS